MPGQHNALIDTLDGIITPKHREDSWENAGQVAQSLGIESILVARANPLTKDFSWITTNLPSEWMSEYIACDYTRIDPLFTPLDARSECIEVDFGRTFDRHHYWRDMDNGLADTCMG